MNKSEIQVGDLVEHITKSQLGIVYRITPNWTCVCWLETGKYEKHSFFILRRVE